MRLGACREESRQFFGERCKRRAVGVRKRGVIFAVRWRLNPERPRRGAPSPGGVSDKDDAFKNNVAAKRADKPIHLNRDNRVWRGG